MPIMDQMPNRDVTELLRRVRQGDAEARERLFELCREYVRHVARAQVETWLQAKVDASDVVQQTLLEAHCGFDGFHGGSEAELLGWMRQILTHNVADFVRRYRATAKRAVGREVPFRDPQATVPRGAPEPSDPGATPSQQFVKLDMQIRVLAALEQLPEDYRTVIRLRNFERLPFSDVAERMSRSRPAAQMLWMRAIRKLQEALGEAGDDGDE